MGTSFFKDKRHLMVYEYLPATTLKDNHIKCDGHQEWVNKVFGELQQGDGCNGCISLNQNGHSNLKKIGALVAVDMLLNNFDRLPCIWQNAGNPNNVMFLKSEGEAVCI